MFRDIDRRQRKPSLLACAGALLAAGSVAMGAYAAHGLDDSGAQVNLTTAAAYAFGHGLALAALAPFTLRWVGLMGLALLLLGTLLFSGSLALDVFFGSGTRLAPYGGMALIAGWVAWGLDSLRR